MKLHLKFLEGFCLGLSVTEIIYGWPTRAFMIDCLCLRLQVIYDSVPIQSYQPGVAADSIPAQPLPTFPQAIGKPAPSGKMVHLVLPMFDMDFNYPVDLLRAVRPEFDVESIITNLTKGKDFKAHELGFIEIDELKIKLLLQIEHQDTVLDQSTIED